MRSLSRIVRSMRELWPYYVMVILAATVTVLLSMASPFLIKHATDTIVDTVNGSVTVEDATTVVIAVAVGLLLAELAHRSTTSVAGSVT